MNGDWHRLGKTSLLLNIAIEIVDLPTKIDVMLHIFSKVSGCKMVPPEGSHLGWSAFELLDVPRKTLHPNWKVRKHNSTRACGGYNYTDMPRNTSCNYLYLLTLLMDAV